MRLEQSDIGDILVATRGALVLYQHRTSDHVQRCDVKRRLYTALPRLREAHAVDAREDVDTPRLRAKHEHLVRARELRDRWHDGFKAEGDERVTEPTRVGGRPLDEYVEVFGEPWFPVTRDGVAAYDDESHAMGDQRS